MTTKTAEEIRRALAQPFAAEDLEWRLQRTYEEQGRGIAVPYVTNRAIQNRLDEVVGVDGWYNDYKPWHGTGKKDAQICGISIWFESRQAWITKWDGAEDSDIEPVKGGLSDSMKRAAVQWGIGRVLYNMTPMKVSIEKFGKSCVIRESERTKLDEAYRNMLDKLHLEPVAAGGTQSQLTPSDGPEGSRGKPSPAPAASGKTSTPAASGKAPAPAAPEPDPYQEQEPDLIVMRAKPQQGMTGISTSLVLQAPDGRKYLGFVRGSHPELQFGARLYNVQKTLRKHQNTVYYELDSFEVENSQAA